MLSFPLSSPISGTGRAERRKRIYMWVNRPCFLFRSRIPRWRRRRRRRQCWWWWWYRLSGRDGPTKPLSDICYTMMDTLSRGGGLIGLWMHHTDCTCLDLVQLWERQRHLETASYQPTLMLLSAMEKKRTLGLVWFEILGKEIHDIFWQRASMVYFDSWPRKNLNSFFTVQT